MARKWMFAMWSVAMSLTISSFTVQASDKSVGVKLGYSFAQSGCESHETECDNQSFTGGAYFRHHFYSPYFYQLTLEYLGRYKATYPALEDPNTSADYKADVYGFSAAMGRTFQLLTNQALIGQIGVMPWYVKSSGEELTYSVSHSDSGVSPFVSLEYQYALSEKSYLGLGYQYVYGVGGGSTGGADLHQIFLGLGYQFGQ